MTETDARSGALRTAVAAVADAAGSGRECPAASVLWESAAEKLDRRANEAVILHVGVCGSCAAGWRLARELSGEGRANPTATRRWTPLGVAASFLIALVTATAGLMLLPDRGPGPVYRALEEVWLTSTIAEGASLSRDRFELTWVAGPEGTTYDIRVGTENLDIVARARSLDEPRFLVPARALEGIPPGSTVVWRVTAHLPDGRTVDSPSFVTPVD